MELLAGVYTQGLGDHKEREMNMMANLSETKPKLQLGVRVGLYGLVTRVFWVLKEVWSWLVGNVADDISPRIQGAATSTKDKVNDVLPSGIKNAAGSVGDRANIVGR